MRETLGPVVSGSTFEHWVILNAQAVHERVPPVKFLVIQVWELRLVPSHCSVPSTMLLPQVWVMRVALHWAVVPPFVPGQLQVYVEGFVVTDEGVPTEQRFEVGAVEKVVPLAEPQEPLVGVGGGGGGVTPPRSAVISV